MQVLRIYIIIFHYIVDDGSRCSHVKNVHKGSCCIQIFGDPFIFRDNFQLVIAPKYEGNTFEKDLVHK